VFVYVHTDESGHLLRAAAVETYDVVPVSLVVAEPGSDTKVVQGWASSRAIPTFPGLAPVVPTVVDLAQLGRFFVRRCGDRRAMLSVFDALGTLGPLAAQVRRPRSGTGLSVAFVGCGWFHRDTGRWMDSDYRSRLRIDPRGDDGGAFSAWIPSRKRWKAKNRTGGLVVDLKVLGAALGHDVESARSLAVSCGLEQPARSNDPLDRLLDEALALVECYRTLVTELDEVAPGLSPSACWSQGSIFTHALRQSGVRSPAETTATLAPEAVGATAAACHGGGTAAFLVGIAEVMGLADLNATHPAMLSVTGLTRHLAAERFEVVPVDPDEVRERFLAPGLRDRLDDRAFWRWAGNLFVVVEPHGEAALPCQREAGDRWRFVVAPLDLSGGTVPVHACDLVEPALHGVLPKIVSAFRIDPVGIAEDIEPWRGPSGTLVDLATGDLGRALIEERCRADAIEDPVLRDCRVVLAKGEAVSGAWGVFQRVDRRQERKRAKYVAIGPTGEELQMISDRRDVSGPFTLWHLGAAIPAACRAFVAITLHDVEALGSTVVAEAVDSIAVPLSSDGGLFPCAGGPHVLPDGQEAVRSLTPDEFVSVLSRFDKVLHPDGCPAWKVEVDSLDAPTIGLVLGVNKMLLGRDENGRFHLLRSSDTGLGDHFLDPTGTGARLPDGRTAWSAALEERLLADMVRRGNDAPFRMPPDLPEWADRPAFRPARASSLDELRRLRHQLGDPGVAPFARYLTVSIAVEHPPMCLGVDRDPATWRAWPWRRGGRPCRIGVYDRSGSLVISQGTGDVFVVPTIRDVFWAWMSENDLAFGGPKRGLRHVLPVRSHPALVELVGRSGELVGERTEDDPVAFLPGAPATLLEEASRMSGAELGRRSGLPARTAQRVVKGQSIPSAGTVSLAVTVVVDLESLRCAAGAECRNAEDGAGAVLGRNRRRWCSPACKEVVRRRSRGIPPRRGRPDALGNRATSPPSSTNGSGTHVFKGLNARVLAGKPSCPSCGSIFIGQVPEVCPDCETRLPERATR
jgi:hypothetical protein